MPTEINEITVAPGQAARANGPVVVGTTAKICPTGLIYADQCCRLLEQALKHDKYGLGATGSIE